MKKSLVVACLVLTLVLGSSGQDIPTVEECQAAFDTIGIDSLTGTLTPCALGPSEACCNALGPTVNIADGQPLAGCLCNQGALDLVVEELEGNNLAQAVGFGMARLLEVLDACGADFVGQNGCVQAPATPDPDPAIPTPPPATAPTPPAPSPPPMQPPAMAPPSPKAMEPPMPEIVKLLPNGEFMGEPKVIFKIIPKSSIVTVPISDTDNEYGYGYGYGHGVFHNIKKAIHKKAYHVGELIG